MNPEDFLNDMYLRSMSNASGQESPTSELGERERAMIDVVIANSENGKAVLAVIATSLAYKCMHPEQDIRRHQKTIDGGYAGRTFDNNYVTPFFKQCKFPSMAESGWLTRSLENKVPYNYNYTGAITPRVLKQAFLDILNCVEEEGVSAAIMFDYLLQKLIIQRDKHAIDLATPTNLTKADIVRLLDMHFHHHYGCKGAARLPVLALYAVYQCLMEECQRYAGKRLLPLESHTSADLRSGRLGDIDIVNEDGEPFEAIEVKLDVPISYDIVERAREKILTSNAVSYYILSTAEIRTEDKARIEESIRSVKAVKGCELVVNGVESSLRYYLRLISSLPLFVKRYAALLSTDAAVKYEHKAVWNSLVAKI